MAEDRDALMQHYRLMRKELLSAIEGLSDEKLVEPSLDGWSVKDHLAHIAFWDEIRVSEIRRISAGYRSACSMSDEQGDALNELVYSLRHSLTVDQVRWELETTGRHVLDAVAAATARGLEPSHYGEAGLRSTHEEQHIDWIKRWRSEQSL